MQKLYSIGLTLVLLLSVINDVCMETKVISLKKLCVKEITKSIQNDNINQLTSEEKINDFLDIPKELDTKITKENFYYKLEHSWQYNKEQQRCAYTTIFEGDSPVIIHTDWNNAIINMFTVNGEKINSFLLPRPLTTGTCAHNGVFVAKNNGNNNSCHIINGNMQKTISNPSLPQYCVIKQVLNKNKELIYHTEDKKYGLYNFDTNQCIYSGLDSIQFDSSQKIYMIKNDNVVEIKHINKKGYMLEKDYIIRLDGIKQAFLNPNGKQLLIQRENQVVELINIENQKRIYSFNIFAEVNTFRIKDDTVFSDDGNYLIIPQCVREEGLVYHMVDTKSGKICMSLTLPSHVKMFFNKKYFVLKCIYHVHMIHVKDLCKMPDFSKDILKIEDLIKLGIGKSFKNFLEFHPDGKHISVVVEPSNVKNQYNLVNIKSEEPVFIVDNIQDYTFSNPCGKMLYLDNFKQNGYNVISLRNDFTVAEYLLNRFMKEKNITESGLVNYPHMQKIYENMDRDKRSFTCLYDKPYLFHGKK